MGLNPSRALKDVFNENPNDVDPEKSIVNVESPEKVQEVTAIVRGKIPDQTAPVGNDCRRKVIMVFA